MPGVRAIFAMKPVAKTACGFAVVDRKAEEAVGPLGRMASASPVICMATWRSAADDTDFCNEIATRDTRDAMINAVPTPRASTRSNGECWAGFESQILQVDWTFIARYGIQIRRAWAFG